MIRIYQKNFKGTDFTLTEKNEIHYLTSVMRIKKDKELLFFNENVGEYLCRIDSLSRKEIKISVIKKIRNPEKITSLRIAFAPIRSTRLSFLVEKATELGATELFPIITDHTTHRQIKLDRLETIAKEATEQCERLSSPKIYPLQTFDEFFTTEKNIIILDERKNDIPLLSEIKLENNPILFIGPEGGFSKKEFEKIDNLNLKKASLGKQILRAETAVLKTLILIENKL